MPAIITSFYDAITALFWSFYVLILRLITFCNPFKELAGYFNAKKFQGYPLSIILLFIAPSTVLCLIWNLPGPLFQLLFQH
jgi:hypothetical protein